MWHLHGHIDEPDRIILTPDGYELLYGSEVNGSQYEAALQTFRSIITGYTILFVGFSLQDESVNAQLNWLEHTFRGQGGRHFVLMRRDEIPSFKARGALRNVEPISYGAHGEPLLACLREMASIVDPDSAAVDRASEPRASMASVLAVPSAEWPAGPWPRNAGELSAPA